MTSIILGLIVFVVAIAVIIVFAGILHWGKNRDIGLLPYIFYPVVFNTVLVYMTSGRNMFAVITYDMPEPVLAVPGYVYWISRVVTLFIIVGVGESIVNRLLHYGDNTKIPAGLLVTFVFFFLTSVIFSAFLGSHPKLSHEYFYLFLGGSAALLFTVSEGDAAIRGARNSLFLCLLISACFAFVKPEIVMSNSYVEGLIPGLTYRYAGLLSHANSLGPLTVVFLLCLWSRPYAMVSLNRFAWILGSATLFMTQSKTSWIAFLLCILPIVYCRYGGFLKRYFLNFRQPIFMAAALSLSMVVATLVVVIIAFAPTGNSLGGFFETRAGAEMMTLTGRDHIWEIAVHEWHRNHLFGYGLTMWDDAHRARIGISGAVTAHNQFYQTLGSAGIVGVVGLLVYSVTLFWYAFKTMRVSQGLTFALFLMLLVRSVSEVPFTMVGYYGAEELTHILLLMVIASHFSKLKEDAVVSKTFQSPVLSG
jgi:O-antigen ligase